MPGSDEQHSDIPVFFRFPEEVQDNEFGKVMVEIAEGLAAIQRSPLIKGDSVVNALISQMVEAQDIDHLARLTDLIGERVQTLLKEPRTPVSSHAPVTRGNARPGTGRIVLRL